MKVKVLCSLCLIAVVLIGCGNIEKKEEGAKILHFLGEETELAGCPYARGDGEYEFITVGKIIAPKGAKAIQYARKAKRIRKLSPKIRRQIKQGMSEDVCGLLFNYSDKEYEKDIQLDMVEYVEK